MSLRDQLVAKGLVSKKRARKVEREIKQERKQAAAHRPKKRDLEREAEARQAAEAEAADAARRAAHEARQAAREARERALQVQNLLKGNRLALGRGHRFWFRRPASPRVSEVQLSSGLAHQLRAGEAALALLVHPTGDEEVVAIPKSAAKRLQQLAPHQIAFFVQDTTGISAPDLALHQRDWEAELGPRRAREGDLERYR